MPEYLSYEPASVRRRAAAFFGNVFILSVIAIASKSLFRDGVKNTIDLLAAGILLAFSIWTDSPGKRIFDLKLLSHDMRPIGIRERFQRNLPFVFLYLATTIASFGFFQERVAQAIVGLFLFGALLFCLADGLAVFLTPDGRSLFDMRLGTRVFGPRRIQGQVGYKLFGVRIW